MRIWNLCLAILLVLTVGFGAGYYAKTVVYSNAGKAVQEEKLSPKNIAKTPLPTIKPSFVPSPSPQGANVSAPGEAYMENGVYQNGNYLLKEYLGNVAVYRIYDGGGQMLVDIVDIGVESLPKSDREMLEMGIVVEDEEEMLQLIEDYTS